LLIALNLVNAVEVAVADPVAAALDQNSVELINTPAPTTAMALSGQLSDQTIDLYDNLMVAAGQQERIENCTITFHCSSPRQFSLWVAAGGSLVASNTTFSAIESKNGFGCEFHGAAHFVNCTFNNVWGNPQSLHGDGGVEIWNSEVSLSGCRISNAVTNGLFIVHCDPNITGTVITDCGDETVEMHGSDAGFYNCTFRTAGWGIIAWDGSYLRMDGCTVSSMRENGVDLIHSKAEVLNCTFEDIGGMAIRVHYSELVSYKGSVFSRVGSTVEIDNSTGLSGSTCITFNIILSVLTIVNIMISGRQRMVVSRRGGMTR
jgi:hypothetical protein